MSSKKQQQNVIVALDVGTSKIVALVAKVHSNGKFDLIGVGRYPSRGLRRGVVVDIDQTTEAIQRAIDAAEQMSGIQISHVTVGIAGSHVRSYNQHSMVTVSGDEITPHDVNRVVEDAVRRVAIPNDQERLHVLPQEFIVDNQPGIRQPVGMSGVSLEVRVHLITGSVSAARNLSRCVENCGLTVSDFVLEQVASSYSVVSEDERELGVCLVDIGAGTTDIAVLYQGAIHHTAVIPIGGDQVTKDIATIMRTPISAAEEIKKTHGCALPQLIDPDEEVEVESMGDRPARCLNRLNLVDVIEARYAELFQLVQQELQRSDYLHLIRAGVVLTGGSSQIEGAVELAEGVLGVPVRLGLPDQKNGVAIQLQDASLATVTGLLKFAVDHVDMSAIQEEEEEESVEEVIQHHPVHRPVQVPPKEEDGVLTRVQSWFKQHF
jgi:cell division protein FtsA